MYKNVNNPCDYSSLEEYDRDVISKLNLRNTEIDTPYIKSVYIKGDFSESASLAQTIASNYDDTGLFSINKNKDYSLS